MMFKKLFIVSLLVSLITNAAFIGWNVTLEQAKAYKFEEDTTTNINDRYLNKYLCLYRIASAEASDTINSYAKMKQLAVANNIPINSILMVITKYKLKYGNQVMTDINSYESKYQEWIRIYVACYAELFEHITTEQLIKNYQTAIPLAIKKKYIPTVLAYLNAYDKLTIELDSDDITNSLKYSYRLVLSQLNDTNKDKWKSVILKLQLMLKGRGVNV